ncbi:DNA ligase D [Flavobacterium album]|uniref:DNA ligase (ATP) n=1 Tax=Flavobacterium album TaxID=2175091 RepID=A0A2S1QZN5_9FLAO|nr:DNA ligase D [Flavobacterium album]AWH85846.1 DNA ligase D [Flavobacterium album]
MKKLSEYNRKRDFDKTKEPEGKVKKSGKELHFVVQKHDASRLHYDWRLEINGVLVSWAVPKGPIADTSVKRLAMHVEDHPMDYIDFEGTIPKGQYGGGTVMVWDTGTYLAEGSDDVAESEKMLRKMHKDGNIKVVMHGKKLKGSYHLVRMSGKEDEWLLLKGKDEYADKREFDQHSVLTGRTLEEIENDNKSEVWQSNREEKKSFHGDVDHILDEEPEKSSQSQSKSKSKPTAKKKTKATEKTETLTSTKNSPTFTAEDVAAAKVRKTFPKEWKPQLATLADAIFDSDEWVFENKYDGYRALIQIHKGKVELVSRNSLSFNSKYKELVEAFSIIKDDMILDGEIVVEDEKGLSHFQWLQYFAENPNRGKLKCYVFDILYFNGYDLTSLELLQRKRILEAVLPQTDEIIYSGHIAGEGTKAMKEAEAKGTEGLIAKKITSHYHVNKRSKEWLKIKVTKEQEMVIGGFTEPKGSRSGFGSLLLGYYEGNDLIYTGKVGTGFNEDSLKDMYEKLTALVQKTSPFKVKPREPKVHWIKPELVAQIKYSEWTETNSLRHPVFIALRTDKKPKDVKKEIATPTDKVVPEEKGKKEVKKTKAIEKAEESTITKTSAKAKEKPADETKTGTPKAKTVTKKKSKTGKPGWDTEKVEVTHPEKVFWPKEGYTKGDVINYYDEMAKWILPYIKDRPQSMRRTPNGIDHEGFFQKNVAGSAPDWAQTEKIHSDSTDEDIEYLICNDKETLIYMANLGCIEINPWSSRLGSLDNPDYIIFDLDPNETTMENLVTTAKKVKEILDTLGIKGYLKTSGGKGLHIFIPIKPKYTYEQSRDFSHIISQAVNNALPKITSLERMPKKRIGKVYLDFLQNGKGKTMSCAYSLRPRDGATASTPLEWEELDEKNFTVKNYNIKTLPERVKEKGDLWEDFFDNAVDLKELLDKLG